MSECWDLQMTPAQKIVLISLADQANDEGVCWPSISTMEARTCLSERTIQRAIQWLESVGILSRDERSGRSNVYILHPKQSLTPVTVSPPSQCHPRHCDGGPPSQCHPTPVTVTGDPRHSDTQNRKGTVNEPSMNRERARARESEQIFATDELPDGFTREMADELVQYRDEQGAPLSPIAFKKLVWQIARSASMCDVSPRRVMDEMMAAGWNSVQPAWVRRILAEEKTHATRTHQRKDSIAERAAKAARRSEARLREELEAGLRGSPLAAHD